MRQSNLEFTPKDLKPIPERFAEWLVPMGTHERWPGVIVRGYNFLGGDPTPMGILHGVFWECVDLESHLWTVVREEL